MRGTRAVIVRIDDLLEILKDYTSNLGDIPTDAKAVKLMVKPTEMGKFAIVADSEDWKHGLPPLEIKFHIKRMHGLIS